MKLGTVIRNDALRTDSRFLNLVSQLRRESYELYDINSKADIQPGTDLVLSIGGDGTFILAAQLVADVGLPILGVNLGRLGFLSENSLDSVVPALLSGDFTVEYRTMLNATLKGRNARRDIGLLPYAVNEVSLHRKGTAVLGINVTVDGDTLPTYWADGLLVATSSGSTAYSLSVGGPICMPDAKVLIITPIAPHNLNVRPLVVPESAKISISIQCRDDKAILTMDNQTVEIDPAWTINVSVAQFSLKRIRLAKSEFVKALTSKLFWGEDIRNTEI
ncbi:MAG: NAD(+)/NADH kinase [Candidatus Cryptobacteroides sp.]|nr:NAD(+)/NADH kinase [Bacteroidales bacterium]MDD6053646.1 NAD(+)/NADH kinase [Bacteroidales bacterium]